MDGFRIYCLFVTGMCVVFCATLAGHSVSTEEPPPPVGLTLHAKVVNVVDGDTFDVEVTHRLRVRLICCRAPETRTRDDEEKQRGLAAAAHLSDLIHGEQVILYIPAGTDLGDSFSFVRVLAHAWHDEKSVAREMIRSGHATEEAQ